MLKIPDCDRCLHKANSNYLVCEIHPEDVDKSRPDVKFRVTDETRSCPQINQSAAVSNFNDSPYVYGFVSAMPI